MHSLAKPLCAPKNTNSSAVGRMARPRPAPFIPNHSVTHVDEGTAIRPHIHGLVAHSDILQILRRHPRDGRVRCRDNERRTETCPKERMAH